MHNSDFDNSDAKQLFRYILCCTITSSNLKLKKNFGETSAVLFVSFILEFSLVYAIHSYLNKFFSKSKYYNKQI